MEEKEVVEELAQAVETWGALPRSSSAERQAAQRYYDEEILPRTLKIVVPREQKRLAGQVSTDGFILTVGSTHEPLAISLNILQPRRVLFLYTRETESEIDHVLSFCPWLQPSCWDKALVAKDDPLTVYREVRAWAQRYGQLGRLAVDPTGGTKTMTAGAAMAAHVIGAQVVYVASDYDNLQRRPIPGSERLVLIDDPYEVFGDLKAAQAQELFAQAQYRSAATLYAELAAKLPRHVELVVLRELCLAYAELDEMKVEEGANRLEALAEYLSRPALRSEGLSLCRHADRLRRHATALTSFVVHWRRMRGETRLAALDLKFLQDTQATRELSVFLYHSGQRREKRGELDVAALLYYRVLEIISQHRLAMRGISTTTPDYSQLCPRVKEHYATAANELFKTSADTALPDKISLMHGWLLLSSLNDPVCTNLNLKQLNGLVESRNNSQFAHGFRPVDAELIKKFRDLLESRLAVLEQHCGWPALANNDQEFLSGDEIALEFTL